MQGMSKGLEDVLERIWSAQGREGTFAEFMEKRARMTEEERINERVNTANASEGNLHEEDGYNCKKCKNKGLIWYAAKTPRGWDEFATRCDCYKVRAAIHRLKRSGLENSLHKLTEFDATEEWQKEMEKIARKYLAADLSGGASLFYGGAVGCGKTFLCSAVCRELLHAGHEVIYMPWVTEAARLKAIVNDGAFADAVAQYREAEILYIDDFFKPTGSNTAPTPADIRLAYDIINYRYINKMPLIISSEHYMPELLAYDEATISRLYERAKGYTMNIKRDASRNYRMRGADAVV